jgi:hypothetical protein
MRRQPTMVGAYYECECCEAGDPIETADPWLNSELRPPLNSVTPREPPACVSSTNVPLSCNHSRPRLIASRKPFQQSLLRARSFATVVIAVT